MKCPLKYNLYSGISKNLIEFHIFREFCVFKCRIKKKQNKALEIELKIMAPGFRSGPLPQFT